MSSSERRNARYARQLDVNVDGLEIVTTNVSTGGAQLCCPAMRYRGFRGTERQGSIDVKVRLPGTQAWLNARGLVRYADLCDDEYLIGFQFTQWTDDGAPLWSGYIETLTGSKPID